jgi:hypothetical protein
MGEKRLGDITRLGIARAVSKWRAEAERTLDLRKLGATV